VIRRALAVAAVVATLGAVTFHERGAVRTHYGTPEDQSVIHASVSEYNASHGVITYRRYPYVFNGRSTEIQDFSFNPKDANLTVVDVLHLSVPGNAYRTYSLTEAYEATHPLLIVPAGAGPQNYPIPTAIGLVVSNGRVVSPLSHNGFAAAVLCISKAGVPSILKASDHQVAACQNAVQSGPLVVYGGRVNAKENPAAAMVSNSVVVIAPNSFHILISSPAYLVDLAHLATQVLHASAALNIASDSGLILNNGTQMKYGPVDAPVAAALVVSK
jgi:uncharacterized protein YigE (DUF2233 family)